MNSEPFYKLKRAAVLGEGPIYRESDNTLHYVDCLNEPPQLHILQLDDKGEALYPDDNSQGFRVLDLEDSVTVTCFRKNVANSYICLYYQGFAFLDEKTGQLQVLKEIIPTEERSIRRFNDGGVDPKGRFWGAEIDVKALKLGAGKLERHYHGIGRLWRYDPDGSVHLMDDGGYVCGNGIAWSPDAKHLFVNDSAGQRIYKYDYDNETGNITNKRIIKEFFGTEWEPDGMVSDTDGNLWIAVYGGHCVLVIDQDGNTVKQVPVGCRNVACTTWGGLNHDIIYIATAYNPKQPSDQGGHLFKIHVDNGVKGLKKNEFDG